MKVNFVFCAIFFVIILLISISSYFKLKTLRIALSVILLILGIIYFIIMGKNDKNKRR